jgi:TonB family protein
MLFARLLESQRAAAASRAMAEGVVVSTVAHALLVGGWLALHRDVEPVRVSPDERFTPVEYLVPRDRLPGLRPQQETVTWTALTPVSGQGYAPPATETPPPAEDRLEIEVARGEEKEIEVAPESFERLPPIALGDSIKTELEVDSTVRRYDDGVAPAYPPTLLRRQVEGAVVVQYVVDTLGRADTSTFRVVSATHPEFARAVKAALPAMRFRPAIISSRMVPQLVQQPFAFRIVDTSRTRRLPSAIPRPPLSGSRS